MDKLLVSDIRFGETSQSLAQGLLVTICQVNLQLGLETAENLSTPVLEKLDSTLGLEEKGNQVLDTLEHQVFAATKLYQDKKEVAVTQGTIASSFSDPGGKYLVTEANKHVHQVLDITEGALLALDPLIPNSPGRQASPSWLRI